MAGTTTKSRQMLRMGDNTTEADLIAQFNKLVDDVETNRAAMAAMATKLNADAGVTDTNYAAPAAAALTAAKIGNEAGTAL